MGKFRKDDSIAWIYSGAESYRIAPTSEWHFCRASDCLSSSSSSLTDLVDRSVGVPEALIELTKSTDTFRISAEIPLVVQEPGDSKPWIADTEVEVSYGSVVRIGPILISVLDAQQVQSFRDGLLDLPLVGEAHTLSKSSKRKGQGRLSLSWKRSKWQTVAMGLPILGLLLLVGWHVVPTAMVPQRVLVVLADWPEERRAKVRNIIGRRLSSNGLQPVFLPQSQTPDDVGIKTLIPAARQHGAVHILVIHNKILKSRTGIGTHSFVAARISSVVGQTRRPDSTSEHSVEFARETLWKIRAMEAIETEAFPLLMRKAIEGIVESAEIDEFTKGPEPTGPSSEAYQSLRKTRCQIRKLVHRPDLSELDFCRPYWEGHPRQIGDLVNIQTEQESPIAISPDGDSLINLVHTKGAEWSTYASGRWGDISSMDRIDVVSRETQKRRTILFGERFLRGGPGPVLSDNGKILVAIEEVLSPQNATRAIVKYSFETETREVVRTLEPNEGISSIKISPDGQYIALSTTLHELEIIGPNYWRASVDISRLQYWNTSFGRLPIRGFVWGQPDSVAERSHLFIYSTFKDQSGRFKNKQMLVLGYVDPDHGKILDLKALPDRPIDGLIGGYGKKVYFAYSYDYRPDASCLSYNGLFRCPTTEGSVFAYDFLSQKLARIPVERISPIVDGYVTLKGELIVSDSYENFKYDIHSGEIHRFDPEKKDKNPHTDFHLTKLQIRRTAGE